MASEVAFWGGMIFIVGLTAYTITAAVLSLSPTNPLRYGSKTAMGIGFVTIIAAIALALAAK